MKNKLIAVIIVVLLFLIAGYWYLKESKPTTISESVAIETIKKQFPELKAYPSNEFPQKSIKTEKAVDGWYVAFVLEGSGVPVVNAQCFLIKDNKSITPIEYTSQNNFNSTEFSAKECSLVNNLVGGDKDEHGCIGSAGYSWCENKQKCLRPWEEACEESVSSVCKRENCHGLDIKCGPNAPDICTTLYSIGDKCLKYAECGLQNNKCQQIENSQFTQCKTCVQACVDSNKDDTVKMFACESKCN